MEELDEVAIKQIEEVADLLHGDGSFMPGREMSNEDATKLVQEHFPRTAYCLVREWIWIDLLIPQINIDELAASGKQPVMLYAHDVIFDSTRRLEAGNFVRTSPLVAFHHDFLFQTQNTVYVLVGNGKRKSAYFQTVARIF